MVAPKRLLFASIGVLFSLISIPHLNKHSIANLPTGLDSALAQPLQGYVPPPRIDQTQPRDGSGARGCANSKAIAASLNLLVPKDHIATTISERPTFLWYLSDKISAPITFTLVDQQSVEPIWEQRMKVEKPGIIQLQIPPSVPALVEGKEYRWTVTLICNEMRPSENTYASAGIERVPVTKELAQKLARASNPQERALILAQSGIWYDAASTLYEISQQKSNKRLALSAINNFSELLKQIGLFQVSHVFEQEQKFSSQTAK